MLAHYLTSLVKCATLCHMVRKRVKREQLTIGPLEVVKPWNVRVPMSTSEWRALRARAVGQGMTVGEYIASAVR
jgi:hypothetical protein